ncbi:hypothetical protein Salat_2545800 [Sesamum alatum]|uniref:Uncharacterized protein n=1 Tax=Sesamum alatum TaxID=300844 RepID=A0AAE1XSK9_9LAMI|nr:hypothetical protein Salat_2545800 [Sesamum alatum]
MLGSREIEQVEGGENMLSPEQSGRNLLKESLENHAPPSPKYVRMEDVRTLLEEAAERGAQTALRLMKEQQIIGARSPSPGGNPRPKSRENSVGSSHAPQRLLLEQPQEVPTTLLEDLHIASLRRDLDELRKQLILNTSNTDESKGSYEAILECRENGSRR